MKYIASCSFGKDSCATIILAHLNNEPLDLIVYSEVMFDKETSAEHPLHRDFIFNKAIPTFEKWGYPVKVLRSTKTDYVTSFNHIVSKSPHSERNGKKRGFLIQFACKLNTEGKVQPIRDFYKEIKEPVTQYIGIAIDEPKRLERLRNTNKVSLLEKYSYTEEMAFELCKEYGLVSPLYNYSLRGGCWFCPNARKEELAEFKFNYPELWGKLENLDRTNLVTPKFNRKYTFEELNERLDIINNAKDTTNE